MTTFDRYLLFKYLHVYVILFVTLFGLFVVIDGFSNVDGFQQDGQSTFEVLTKMALYYSYQSSLFFDMVGSILSAIAVLLVFALLQRHSEIHPILAAGVPTFRLLVPVLAGTMMVNTVLVANQEFVIPRISHVLQASRSGLGKGTAQVTPVYDNLTHILISGKRLSLNKRMILDASFVLPAPTMGITQEFTQIEAPEATFVEANGNQPAGWLLKNATPRYEAIKLTDKGREFVRPVDESPNEVFVVTDLNFDQLYNRDQSYTLVSTPELVRRLKNPSFGIISVRGQVLHFHSRIARPFINLVVVLVAVPLVVRKESRGLVTNMAVCTGVLAVLLGVIKLSMYMGQVNLVRPEMAAWLPLFFCGGLGAWLTGVTQT